jgi:hypothetical protein
MAPTSTPSIPTLDDFLAAPAEQVVAVAPATLVLDLRSAPLSAIHASDPDTEQVARMSHVRMLACIEGLFHLGVRHIVPFFVGVDAETDQDADRRFLTWSAWQTTGAEALATYERCGCRVRLVGAESLHELRTASDRLPATAPADGVPTLWWSVLPSTGALWSIIAAALQRAANTTQAGLIRALYGEDIPPATMLLGFGPPVAPPFTPLLLADEMQCYWSQRLGFALDEQVLRRIFYDYAYVRPTRTDGDRSWRYTLVEQQRAAWETDAVLGIGQHMGGLWYPQRFPAAAIEGDQA